MKDIKPWGIVIYCIPALLMGLWIGSAETALDLGVCFALGLPITLLGSILSRWAVEKWLTYPTDEFVPPITK